MQLDSNPDLGHPGEIIPFTMPRTERCGKMFRISAGAEAQFCKSFEGHIGACRAGPPNVPKLMTDPLSQPYNPDRR